MAGTSMKPPPTPITAESTPMPKPTSGRRDDRDVEARLAEARLQRQPVHPVMRVQPAPNGAAAAQDGAHRFHHHQHADRAQHHDVEERNREVHLPDPAQQREELDAGEGAEQAAGQQHAAHPRVHVAALPLRDEAGHAGAERLVGAGGDRHGRGDADQDQQRRQQEAAAHAEQAREPAHAEADADQQEGIGRHFGDRQVDLHRGFRSERTEHPVARGPRPSSRRERPLTVLAWRNDGRARDVAPTRHAIRANRCGRARRSPGQDTRPREDHHAANIIGNRHGGGHDRRHTWRRRARPPCRPASPGAR